MIRIVVEGLIGYGAASELLKQHRQELEARFSRRFIRDFEELAVKVPGHARPVSGSIKPILVTEIGEGGLFGALWQMCEQLESLEDERFRPKAGVRVYLEKIPVKQEVIEICELFDEDPYEAESPGALLIVWDDRDMAIRPDDLEQMSDYGSEIGFITNDNKRILYNGEQVRYLTPLDRQMKDIVDRRQHY